MKKIGIGFENYKEFIEKDLYYVDKTLLVRDVLDKGGKVTLLLRPRRFGKTLGLSMLRTFFEEEYDFNGQVIEKRRYFEDKKIMSCGEGVLCHLGRYPVINLSLKGAKQSDFASAFLSVKSEIIDEYRRHEYLRNSDRLSDEEKQEFVGFLGAENEWREREKAFKSPGEREAAIRVECGIYVKSLKKLSMFLKKHHRRNVMMLLDEYDVPLENAWYKGYYGEMADFVRSLFEASLKTNDALERAVITGCLRISRESIFTGMNHLEIVSVRSRDFAESFGFTQEEIRQFLCYYGLDAKAGELQEWYDGYLFGGEEIYNPWSVVNYVKKHLSWPDAFPEPYWSNTSSNSIIKDLVERSDEKTREELDALIGGGTIEKRIHEDITYADIYESDDNLWNFLFFTGYMRMVSERQEGKYIYVTMKIPNLEVADIYETQIRFWFDKQVKLTDRTELYRAIMGQDLRKIEEFLSTLLKQSISTFDSAESFYHGYLLSMLTGIKDYRVRSNREEGDGRPDIILYPENPTDPAYLFECKYRKKFNEMSDGLKDALQQIEDKRYEEGILDDGYADVISYGICFCKKSCIIGLYEKDR